VGAIEGYSRNSTRIVDRLGIGNVVEGGRCIVDWNWIEVFWGRKAIIEDSDSGQG
jgi:hypothetical protein